jgi:hypothetical protein
MYYVVHSIILLVHPSFHHFNSEYLYCHFVKFYTIVLHNICVLNTNLKRNLCGSVCHFLYLFCTTCSVKKRHFDSTFDIRLLCSVLCCALMFVCFLFFCAFFLFLFVLFFELFVFVLCLEYPISSF